jgi:hypothetical protein
MAIAQELPIYKSSFDLLVDVTKITSNFPRNFKIGIARDLCFSTQNIMTLIFKCNCSTKKEDKIALIEKIREEIALVILLLRLSVELKLISPAQHGKLSLTTMQISKQSQGWLNYYRK